MIRSQRGEELGDDRIVNLEFAQLTMTPTLLCLLHSFLDDSDLSLEEPEAGQLAMRSS
jgi:hypothetical protein